MILECVVHIRKSTEYLLNSWYFKYLPSNMQDIINCGMTPSCALDVDKGLSVKHRFMLVLALRILSPVHIIIKEPEGRREAGLVNKGPDLYSLQPENTKLGRFQACLPHTLPCATYCSYLH